jgi:hypothetical protein
MSSRIALSLIGVIVPLDAANGDQTITATYNGLSTQVGTSIAVQS